MGVMPGNIAKGPLLEAFDNWINEDPDHLRAALTQYKDMNKGLRDIVDWSLDTNENLQRKPILPWEGRDHIVKHWLAELGPTHSARPIPHKPIIDPDPYWPTAVPMGRVLREGLIRALETCRYVDVDAAAPVDRNPDYLPIDSYWICAGSHFEVVVTVGTIPDGGGGTIDHHVNMLILSPSVPFSRHGEAGFSGDEKIWVVKHSDPSPGEVDKGVRNHVRTVRLRK